jgi:two-component system, chemotaxis family, chemotaxis protein CheY
MSVRVDGSGRSTSRHHSFDRRDDRSSEAIIARILVIDDDILVRQTLSIMLQLEDHEVTLAPHGEDGLQRFHEQSFDLLICDVFMPRRGGTETVSAIRRLAAQVPIITMTGGAGDTPTSGNPDYAYYLEITRQVGATATITKPFKPRDLFALIRQCLDGGDPPTP